MKNKLQDQLSEDALLREVVEEVKNEQLQQVWNKYGLFIIIGIALILTAAISFESLKNWQIKKQQELSNAYSVALSLQNQGRLDESLEIYTMLADKASGIYADTAKLQMANIYMEQGKKDEAFGILQAMADGNAETSQMTEIAALKLASYKLDANAPAAEVIALLEPALKDGNASDVARELKAMLLLREKDTAGALSEYEKIISSPNAADALKTRATDMINLLKETN